MVKPSKNRLRNRPDRRPALRCRVRPQLERLEDRLMLDVSDILKTATSTGIGPGAGVFTVDREAIGGDSPVGNLDVDIYSVRIPKGLFTLTAVTTRPPGAARLDTFVRLFVDTGAEVAIAGVAPNNDRGPLTPAGGATIDFGYSTLDVTLNSLLEQTVYIGVSANPNNFYDPTIQGSGNPGPTGEYTLTVSMVPGGEALAGDQGGTIGSALDTGLTAAGGTFLLPHLTLNDPPLFGNPDVDMFRIDAAAGSGLVAMTTFPPGTTPANTILRLFNADGVELALNDNRSPFPGSPNTIILSLIDFKFPLAGTYYLGVSGSPNGGYNPTTGAGLVAGATGDYALMISVTPPAPPGVITGRVFNDANGLGLEGATVYLDRNANGQFDEGVDDQAVTDAEGNYAFAGLAPGTYRVGHVPLKGYVQTSPVRPPGLLVEGFNRPELGYSVFDPINPSATTLATTHTSLIAAHEGSRGLRDLTGNDWIVRTDSQVQVAQGDTLSAWVRIFGETATGQPGTGRAYFGFGASSTGALSVQIATNTGEFLLQQHTGYGFVTLASASQTYVANQWYRLEVQWGATGTITARLLGEDGVTQLNSITGSSSAIQSGGIAFRAFGNLTHWDEVTVTAGLPLTHTVTLGSAEVVTGLDFGAAIAALGANGGPSESGPLGDLARALFLSDGASERGPDIAPITPDPAAEPVGVDLVFAETVGQGDGVSETGLPDNGSDQGDDWLADLFPPDGLPTDGPSPSGF